MTARRGALALPITAVAMALACATQESQKGASSGAIEVRTTAVVLNPADRSQNNVGHFAYAGGLALDAPSVHFGGLSDLDVSSDNRMLVVSDVGQLVEARLVLDAMGRLAGLTDVMMSPLAGTDGRPLTDKTAADSEGIAALPNGDRLVSFERQHRIWRYPAGRTVPVPAPTPAAAQTFPPNAGLEALAALPGASDSYLAGSEGGSVWLCSLADGCRDTELGSRVPKGFGLTAIRVSPDGRTLALLARSFEPARGVRVVLRLLPRAAIDSRDVAQLDELVLNDPLTRDNFEGVALVAGADRGALRIYLLSDNNYSASQHTYLLAFDWRPENGVGRNLGSGVISSRLPLEMTPDPKLRPTP